RELTDKNVIDNKNVSYERVRKQLIDKLYGAFSHRAWQAKMLRSYIEQLGGDAIVCGDFNDIPGCRTIHILEQIGMKDAYSELATGPTITFNAPHFYFRIDHVLWRGNFRAVDIERGNVASSDHYPLLTTFVWDADAASSPQQEGTKD
ncbi:MAG: endonuclease/exonuclease/phosphatase family protein, partial [Muribaculaceae bacterium]|nr:endonuclease/exonuclease/phosphatase family protein [Muribaculaceae bacterium]